MSTVKATYTDEEGRQYVTLVPEGQEHMARSGIPVGPPDLTSLGLPIDIEVRLHNALYDRNILTLYDAKQKASEVQAALQGALKVGTHTIISLYQEATNGHAV